jgi:hypothetical protein
MRSAGHVCCAASQSCRCLAIKSRLNTRIGLKTVAPSQPTTPTKLIAAIAGVFDASGIAITFCIDSATST